MIDAGFTGSRLNIYKFNNCHPLPAFDTSWAFGMRSLLAAVRSLDVLLEEAASVLPRELKEVHAQCRGYPEGSGGAAAA
jgi:Golgi nucleoside diphosphatase